MIDYLISSTNKHASIQKPLKDIILNVLESLGVERSKKYSVISISNIINLLSTVVRFSNLYLYKSQTTDNYKFRCDIFNQLLSFHSKNILLSMKSIDKENNKSVAKTLINCLELALRNINSIILIDPFSIPGPRNKESKKKDTFLEEKDSVEARLEEEDDAKKIIDYFEKEWETDKEHVYNFIDEFF